MFETLALNTLLLVLNQLLGSEVFNKIEQLVKHFFDTAFDDMPGADKFDAVMESVGPVLSGALVFFAKALIELMVVKYSPKIKEFG